jgi:hypothetical protein
MTHRKGHGLKLRANKGGTQAAAWLCASAALGLFG